MIKNINDFLPKIPGMKWGALTNKYPTDAKIKELNKFLPHDGKWHSVLEYQNSIDVDGVTIRRKTSESMT